MSYCGINKQELLQKTKDKYHDCGGKEKAAIYYLRKRSETDFKYFIGYKGDNTIRPLCIILPQMNGDIKYFDNGGKNVSLIIEHDSVLVKHNDIWNNNYRN